MTYQILMTYCEPERLVPGMDGHRLVRAPGSPTRPARPWETNTWWEDIDSAGVRLEVEAYFCRNEKAGRITASPIVRPAPAVGVC